MLTKLTFKNNNPNLKQKIFPQYPNAFCLVPIMDSELFKKWNINEDTIMIGVVEIENGIYDAGLNFNYTILDYTDYKVIDRGYCAYMRKDGNVAMLPMGGNSDEIRNFDWANNKSLYGVADNIEQVKEYFKPAIDNNDVCFVISVTEIHKKDQPKDGGWRWHKWGEYIGNKRVSCFEYLYDTPEVEMVYCFNGYYVTKKAEL